MIYHIQTYLLIGFVLSFFLNQIGVRNDGWWKELLWILVWPGLLLVALTLGLIWAITGKRPL